MALLPAMVTATLRLQEMALLPATVTATLRQPEMATLRQPEMVLLRAAETLRPQEMAQLRARATLPGPEMAQLRAAGILGRVAVEEKGTVPRLVSVQARATFGSRAFVRAATVWPLAAVCLRGPAASQTAVSLQQALGRGAGLLVWALWGRVLAAAALVGWAWLGWQECHCKLFRRT